MECRNRILGVVINLGWVGCRRAAAVTRWGMAFLGYKIAGVALHQLHGFRLVGLRDGPLRAEGLVIEWRIVEVVLAEKHGCPADRHVSQAHAAIDTSTGAGRQENTWIRVGDHLLEHVFDRQRIGAVGQLLRILVHV